MPLHLVKRVAVANSGHCVPVEVVHASFEDMVTWQRRIQVPFLYGSGVIGANWDWPQLYLGCVTVEYLAGRAALAVQLRVQGADGQGIPICQAILSVGYYWPGDLRQRCVFVWLLGAAPRMALEHHGVKQRFATLAPMLDVAIQISREHGFDGRLGLHVSDEGTPDQRTALRERYARLGFQARPRRQGWFRWPIRRDDGDLLYLTADSATSVTKLTDELR
jgi:hypothetical protein